MERLFSTLRLTFNKFLTDIQRGNRSPIGNKSFVLFGFSLSLIVACLWDVLRAVKEA